MATSRRNRFFFVSRRVVFVCIAVNLVIGCACSRQNRHAVLTFFFTGVPPLEGSEVPSAEVHAQKGGTRTAAVKKNATQALPPLHKHPPFAEGNCSACHNVADGNRLFNEPEKLCFRCHEDFANVYRWVHGPAAVGSCNLCHEPHQSRNEHLLKSKTQDICFKCHEKKDILSASYHQSGREKVCITCHNPHGGADRRLLKTDRTAAGPDASGALKDQPPDNS